MFGRKKDQGLYTGDAPVSMPGFDGAEPTEYGTAQPSPWYGQSTTTPYDQAPAAPYAQAPAPEFGSPPGAPYPVPPPPFTALGSQQMPLAYQADLLARPELLTGVPGRSTRRTRPIAAWIVGPLVLLVVCAIAVALISHRSTGTGTSSSPPVGATSKPTGPPTAAIGQPVAVDYDGSPVQITVTGATVQPGQSWAYANTSSTPVLLVEVDIRRTDAGGSQLEIRGWDFTFTPSEGSSVPGDIIGDYEPAIDDITLAAGHSVHGYLSFSTGARSGAISFEPLGSFTPEITWSLEAKVPAPVQGALGRPVHGVVSAPPFTVTLTKPRTVTRTSKEVTGKPTSGHYLVLDVAVAPTAITADQTDLGTLSIKNFQFRPQGSTAATAPVTASRVPESRDLWTLVLTPGQPVNSLLAFDTAATAGTVVLVDGGNNQVISWSVAAAGH